MRILAVYRHYWPDATPYARLLKSILERAVAEGHDVAVLTAQPSYNDVAKSREPWRETLGGVAVRRVRLLPERKRWRVVRLANSLYFLMRAVVHATVGCRYDLLIANGHPPVLTACALWLIRLLTGTPYVLHLQDIHPESLRAVGQMRDGWAYRLARRIDIACCRRASKIVTLSEDMAAALVERGIGRGQIEIINNCPLPVAFGDEASLTPHLRRTDAPLFLFAGNLGDFQALDQVVAGARFLAERGREFRLVFLGAGAARERLIGLAGDQLDRTIFFLPHVAPEVAVAAMRQADYGIVSLAPQVYRYAYPSKSMTYLAAGCPIVALVEPESELARTTVRESLGYVVADHTPEAIADVMEIACDERDDWTSDRRRELAAKCDARFGEQKMLKEWVPLLARPAVEPSSQLRTAGLASSGAPSTSNSLASNPPAWQPIIILGAPRSGTNMLRDLLAALPGATTWPCDEINYIWRHHNARWPDDALPPERATERVRRYIRRAFDRQARRGGGATFVIEKTCANTLRVDFVRQVFPDAKFIHIVRDGRDVAASAAERWRAPLEPRYLLRKSRFVPLADLPSYALRYLNHRCRRLLSRDRRLPTWGPKTVEAEPRPAERTLVELCGEQWRQCVHAATQSLARLPADSYAVVRYESFIERPVEETTRLLQLLGNPYQSDRVAALAGAITAHSVGKWRRSPDAEAIERLSPMVEATLDAALNAGRMRREAA